MSTSSGALRCIAALLALLVVLVPDLARAAGACGPVEGWAERCAAAEGLRVEVKRCAASRAVLATSPEGAEPLDVEIAPAPARGFVREGEWMLSPIGEFADWNREPAPRREALATLRRCVGREPPPRASGAAESSDAPHMEQSALRRSWPRAALVLLVAALGWLGAVLWRRGGVRWLRVGVVALGVLAAVVVTRRLRLWIAPSDFLHQNGQGPLWVEYALRDLLGLSDYGPGYPELFSHFATRDPAAPDLAIFQAQSWLAALAPVALGVAALRLGVSRNVSLLMALTLALDPFVARAAQSESYFGVQLSLLALAAPFVAESARAASIGAPGFWPALIGAGALVLQLARVHPVGWLPAAALPLVALVVRREATWRERALRALGIGLAIGVVVALLTGAELYEVLRGELGRKWLRPRAAGPLLVPSLVAMAIAVGVTAIGVRLRAARLALAALGFALVVFVAARSDLLGDPNPTLSGVAARAWWPVLLLLAAVVVDELRERLRGRWQVAPYAVAVVALGAQLGWGRGIVQALPSDVLEARAVREWRATLPPGAVVVSVERAGDRLAVLPLYGAAPGQPRRRALKLGEAGRLHAGELWWRGTLCDGEEAAGFCRAVEQGARLEPLQHHRVVARPSMRGHRYQNDPLRLELYRVLPR